MDGTGAISPVGLKLICLTGTTSPVFRASAPRVLLPNATIVNYDITEDAERFLTSERVGEQSGEVIIVVNWFEELKQRVPTGR